MLQNLPITFIMKLEVQHNHIIETSEPIVDNIVTVTYFSDSIINTREVFKYLNIHFISHDNKYKKNVPHFGVVGKILSLRYSNQARGIRTCINQMENICSFDVSVDGPPGSGDIKVVHCKISSQTCHVTGARSYEQGMQATNIAISEIKNVQNMINKFRICGDSSPFYELYKGERDDDEIKQICEDIRNSDDMLYSDEIIINESRTSNCVHEFHTNFTVLPIPLCKIAAEEGYIVKYHNSLNSTSVSIEIKGTQDSGAEFYHKITIYYKGNVRMSSQCDEIIARTEGYRKVSELLFKVWKFVYLEYKNMRKCMYESEIIHRANIEDEYSKFIDEMRDKMREK